MSDGISDMYREQEECRNEQLFYEKLIDLLEKTKTLPKRRKKELERLAVCGGLFSYRSKKTLEEFIIEKVGNLRNHDIKSWYFLLKTICDKTYSTNPLYLRARKLSPFGTGSVLIGLFKSIHHGTSIFLDVDQFLNCEGDRLVLKYRYEVEGIYKGTKHVILEFEKDGDIPL
jgi:hypothetical protein